LSSDSPDTGLPFRQGSSGDGVRDLHERLARSGFLTEIPADVDVFTDETTAAVRAFQESRGLRSTGVCSERTWAAIIASHYRLGDRLLYLQTPMTRGDDVEELQRSLGQMGFDAGRPDGIFGPDTAAALTDFQRNAGLIVDCIAGHETLAALRRIQGRAGTSTVAAVREHEKRRNGKRELAGCTVIIGDLGGQRALADLTARAIRREGATVAVVEQPDESDQATAANEIGADVYIGFELSDSAACRVAYYSVPGFTSVGGSNLSDHIVEGVEQTFVDDPVRVDGHGMRLEVLRQTRMPAVVLRAGPPVHVVEFRAEWSRAISNALAVWIAEPAAS